MGIHAVLYYQLHKTFHSSATLYKYHRFHHRFKEHTPPMAANAVSLVEYTVAYILPFAFAALVIRPTRLEFRVAITVLSVCNLLVHTPALEKLPGPAFWVMPSDHQAHHRLVNVHFASPTINIDWILEQWNGKGNDKKVS